MLDMLAGLIKGVAPTAAGLLGGPAGSLVLGWIAEKVLGNAAGSAVDIVNKLKADPETLVRLKELDVQLQQIDLSKLQLVQEVNLANISATTESIRQGGLWGKWRDLIGWALAPVLIYNIALAPIVAGIFKYSLPVIDMTILQKYMMLLLGGLGLS